MNGITNTDLNFNTSAFDELISRLLNNIPNEAQSSFPVENSLIQEESNTHPNETLNNNPQLAPLSPPKAGVDLLILLQTIQVKLDELGVSAGKEDARDLSLKNEEHHKEVIEALQKSIAEMEKAQKSGFLSKIFGWIAAAAMMVVGAVMVATGAGCVAGALMMGLAADQMIGMITGESLMSKLTVKLAEGLSALGMKEPASTIMATIIVTAVMIVATMGASSASSATSTATSTATSATASATASATTSATQAIIQSVLTAMKQIASNLRHSDILQLLQSGALATTTVAGAGQAATGMITAAHQKEADDAKADELKIRKVITQNQAYIDNVIEHMKALIENSESTLSQMVNFINQEHDTNQTLIRQMA